MQVHKVAELFPSMTQEDYDALKADIAVRGLLEPVWVHEGAIVDGRHRYKACVELGIAPQYREWNGSGSLVEFVVALNMRRRHLSASQKAVVALEIEAALALEAKERQRLAALQTNTVRWDNGVSLTEKVPYATNSTGEAREQAASIVGVNPHYITDAKRLQKDAPQLLDKVRNGELTLQEAKREVKREERAAAKSVTPDNWQPSDAWRLYHGDVLSVGMALEANSIDCIITDPPYPKEYLSVYSDLSKVAAHVLKPNGFLIAMVGQSWLPEVIARLGERLTYHWTCAYLTPGSATPIWNRRANSNWKPLLWYVKGTYEGDMLGTDVFKSTADDKRFHHWGQSEQGMAALVERLTYPGQLILDPFLGGGTTGVVSIRLKRRFIGIDTDQDAIETSKQRLHEAENDDATTL